MQASDQVIEENRNTSDNGESSSEESSVISVSSVNDSGSASDFTTCLVSPILNNKSVIESTSPNLNDSLDLLNINHPNNFRPSLINEDSCSYLSHSLSVPVNEQKYDLIMSNLNVGHMLKIIPEFDGSPKNLDKFLACCEIVYNPLNAKEDKSLFLEILKSKLRVKPFDVVKYGCFNTWEDLKKEFLLQFSDSRPVEQLQVELVQLKQKLNESVREFASNVEQLLSDLNKACISREGEEAAKHIRSLNSISALNTFQNGLKEPFRLLVKACRFSNLKDAISKAVEEEASQTNISRFESNIPFSKNFNNSLNSCREK